MTICAHLGGDLPRGNGPDQARLTPWESRRFRHDLPRGNHGAVMANFAPQVFSPPPVSLCGIELACSQNAVRLPVRYYAPNIPIGFGAWCSGASMCSGCTAMPT